MELRMGNDTRVDVVVLGFVNPKIPFEDYIS